MRQNDPEFEADFERALAAYADPADAGQAQRLTARVLDAVGKRQRMRRWILLAVAVPALAGIFLAFFLRVRPRGPMGRSVRVAQSQPPSPPARLATPAALPAVKHVRVRPRKLPKLDEFPTPQPLTEDERRLVYFASHATKQSRESVLIAQRKSLEPLQITEVKIPLVASDSQPE